MSMSLNIKPFYPFDHPSSIFGEGMSDYKVFTSEQNSSSNISNKDAGPETTLSRYHKQKSLYKINYQISEINPEEDEETLSMKMLKSLDII